MQLVRLLTIYKVVSLCRKFCEQSNVWLAYVNALNFFCVVFFSNYEKVLKDILPDYYYSTESFKVTVHSLRGFLPSISNIWAADFITLVDHADVGNLYGQTGEVCDVHCTQREKKPNQMHESTT